MKKLPLILFASAALFVNCTSHDNAAETSLPLNKDAIKENAKAFFGDIDPNQNWSSINQGRVTITADADMDAEIVKVQILTESPFLNSNAKVLNESKVQKGETVTLSYDAPNAYDKLIAACVDKNGTYYIQVFEPGQKKTVSFGTRSKRATPINEAPTFNSITLRSFKSFNALRAEAAEAGELKIDGKLYTDIWQNSNWENEMMWEPTLANTNNLNNGWKMYTEDKGCIYRELDELADEELENVKAIVNAFIYKYANDQYSVNGKKNNARTIRNSEYFEVSNNYLETTGEEAVTLIPIQAYTTEFKMNQVFYYYFKESEIEGMDSVEQVNYIKQLPKFKAIQIEKIETTQEATNGVFFRRTEFLLPFYGENPKANLVDGSNAASAVFPAGYKVGFLNMKKNSKNPNINVKENGCTYGDGRLNYCVNHISGHYLSAMDLSIGGKTKEGMDWTDPRIALFTANNKTYMCFEDGSDCNFSDMIIEIGGGLKKVNEKPQPELESYSMCFEDEPETADYDMNDVVLQVVRTNSTTLQVSVIALGGYDQVVLQGIGGPLENKELHQFFGIEAGSKYINTQKNAEKITPKSFTYTIDEDQSVEEFLKNVSIKNLKTNQIISMPADGEPPYAVIVPNYFQYPLEKTSIADAYPDFIDWAHDRNAKTNWYLNEDSEKVYTRVK